MQFCKERKCIFLCCGKEECYFEKCSFSLSSFFASFQARRAHFTGIGLIWIPFSRRVHHDHPSMIKLSLTTTEPGTSASWQVSYSPSLFSPYLSCMQVQSTNCHGSRNWDYPSGVNNTFRLITSEHGKGKAK